MTAGIPTVTAPASGRLQGAVNDAAKRLYDAEAALHIARPALHGVLVKVRDLGLTLVSVRRLGPGGQGR